ncbi:MAG TPA: glycosyltransferase [Gaiellaceae bacterium]|nr:glycosyltransferase [Gaiellaceae bacterium]
MPLVTVLIATHDDAQYLREAVDSVLRQTFDDLELLVVDDASTDETPELLDAIDDPRLRVLRNDAQLGLAASLNRGLEHAQGRYLARLDADDIALPQRLERQLEQMDATGVAALGSAILDIDAEGHRGREHRMPVGRVAVRWHALFSSPFFHPTVLVDGDVLDRHGLRYDVSFRESEDYDLWTRLLATGAEGGNVPEPLVLKRVHRDQASLRRGRLQRSFQRKVALREIARISRTVDAELAWSFGINASRRIDAARAYRELLRAFERLHGADEEVRTAAARRLARGRSVGAAARVAVTRRRHGDGRGRAIRVTVVSPEPTPYRSPLFDRIAARDDVELTVVYAAPTVASRQWTVEPRHRAVVLRGVPIRALRPVLRHDYPLTPGIGRALRASRPDTVVVSGWSTFAAQRAVSWCRRHGVPYVLLVESHDAGPRAAWRRAVKDALVPPIVRGAAACLAVGTLARESLVARGALAERVRVFANTVDVDLWTARADELRRRRPELRATLGAADDDVVVLSVGRLVREKGFRTLLDAARRLDDERLLVAVAGSGPEHAALESHADGVRLRLLGELDEGRLAEMYVAADVFALLSTHEPWGVVVNEAAVSGLPLVLSDRVGAARDLLRHGENGFVVGADDVPAAADAIRALLDPQERRRAGARSRELVRTWDYDASVEAFVETVREAATAR